MKIKLILLVLLIAGNCLQARWEQCNNGLYGGLVKTLFLRGDVFYAGLAGSGIYSSNDSGNTWELKYSGYLRSNTDYFASFGEYIFAGNSFNLCSSTDSGKHWNLVRKGTDTLFKCLAVYQNDLLAGTDRGVYLSKDLGRTWIVFGLSGSSINKIAVRDRFIVAVSDSIIYSTSDSGNAWSQSILSNDSITFLGVNGNNFFVASKGIYQSTDEGISWSLYNMKNVPVELMAIDSNRFVVKTLTTLSVSTDFGVTWFNKFMFGSSYKLNALCIKNNTIIFGDNSGCLVSNNFGDFIDHKYQNFSSFIINSIASKSNGIYVCTNNTGVYFSSDNGDNWLSRKNNLNVTDVFQITGNEDLLFAGTSKGIYFSADSGKTWTAKNSILSDKSVNVLELRNYDLFAGCPDGLYKSTDYGSTWTLLLGNPVYALANDAQTILAGINNGLYFSSDNGNNWNLMTTLESRKAVSSVFISKTTFYTVAEEGLFVSKDRGKTWSNVYPHYVRKIAASDGNIFLIDSTSVYFSFNYGLSWWSKNDGLESCPELSTIKINGNYSFLGTKGNGVFRQTLDLLPVFEGKTETNESFSIYSNKNQDELFIRFYGRLDLSFDFNIFDLNGHLLETGFIPAGTTETTVDISCLTTGVYIVVVGDKVVKFIKE